jgi:hypothetical protein
LRPRGWAARASAPVRRKALTQPLAVERLTPKARAAAAILRPSAWTAWTTRSRRACWASGDNVRAS